MQQLLLRALRSPFWLRMLLKFIKDTDMKNLALFVSLAIGSTLWAQEIPQNWQALLQAAEATGDSATVEHIKARIAELYPAPTEQVVTATEASDKKQWHGLRDHLSGDIAAGATYNTGNTSSQQYLITAKAVYDDDTTWKHTLKLEAASKEESNIRSEERYRATGNSSYRIDEKNFVFAELDFLSDRYGTYNYRITESLGYGRNLYTGQQLNVSANVGLGMRQAELTNNTKDNTMLGRVGADADWQLTPQLKFEQSVKGTFGGEAAIYESNSGLINKLSERLYLKMGLDVEHVSDVPVGTKNTDTKTTIQLGYTFGG